MQAAAAFHSTGWKAILRPSLEGNSQAGAASSVPLLVVAAHPDDEVIGAGAQLHRWPGAHFLTVTDGAPRDLRDAAAAGFTRCEDYARARLGELTAALSLAGVPAHRCRRLHYPDQGTARLLEELTLHIVREFAATQPVLVITHPYEGGHPDHDSTAFAVHHACHLLKSFHRDAPLIVEMTSYHNRADSIATGEFLPGIVADELAIELNESEIALKKAMLKCFGTQQTTLEFFPVGVEKFRLAPEYDFTAAPHRGVLFYELFDWGIRGSEWRELASEAQRVLAHAWSHRACQESLTDWPLEQPAMLPTPVASGPTPHTRLLWP